ncbi:uncharacterized protein LOC128998792 [Macrosteles quadrilineatus]|uniref:uncharacterized protein LOC128998792 n=1 Tax=Macrosteles quadrilineatus TaxID=74068 RepID=UPI0023E19C94|nr:uncharacterized protein LOC128998792 [Macrosteles quadrilineatus]
MDQSNYVTRVVIPMISDHDAILMDVTPQSVTSTPPHAWMKNYKCDIRTGLNDPLRILRFKTALNEIAWDDIIASRPQGESCFDSFFSHLQEALDTVFPVKEKRAATLSKAGRPKPKKSVGPRISDWYTPTLSRLKEFMLMLRARGDEARYLLAKKLYNKRVEEAKRAGNVKFIENSNNQCKAAWDVINSVKPPTPGMRCAASPDEFNNFFISSVSDIVTSIPDAPSDPLDILKDRMPEFQPDLSKTVWTKVNEEKVRKIISGLKSTVSRDYYGWSTKFLKEVADVIIAPLTLAINDSLQQGFFPALMKIARTVPIYKKGDPNILASYRPISLVPVLGKVLEIVIKEQTCNYFESNNLFSDSQHGFRRGRSTTGAVSVIADEIANAFEDSESVSLHCVI